MGSKLYDGGFIINYLLTESETIHQNDDSEKGLERINSVWSQKPLFEV